MKRFRLTLIAICALACLAPAAAGAYPTVEKRTFKVEIAGYQNNRWDFHHTSQGKCDQTVDASGHEYLTFATRRAVTVTAVRIGNTVVFVTPKDKPTDVTLSARIDRGATHTASPLDPTCTGANGGGAAPAPKPDCGVHHSYLDVDLEWWHKRSQSGLTVDTNTLIPPLLGVYRNCPTGGTTFPELLDYVNGRRIFSPAEPGDLFDRSFKKHILLGNGREHSSSTGGSQTTKLHWAVTLTAVD